MFLPPEPLDLPALAQMKPGLYCAGVLQEKLLLGTLHSALALWRT